ncbi:hypothetical protein [Wenyingzhuangia sp. IMCC45467]
MGGEGSMSSMRNILRNNKNLLRKKSMFSNNDTFKSLKKNKDSFEKNRYETKEISESELRILRDKIIKNRRKNIRNIIIFSVIFLSVSTLLFFQINSFHKQRKAIPNNEKENNSVYYMHINTGDRFSTKNEWEKAIIKYESAIELLPEKYVAYHRLAFAVVSNCITNKNNCENSEKLVNQIIEKFPEKENELKVILNRLKTR